MTEIFGSIAILLMGLAIGTAAGWFFRSSRARSEIESARLGSGPDLALMEQRASQAEELLRDARARLEQIDKERVAATRARASRSSTVGADRQREGCSLGRMARRVQSPRIVRGSVSTYTRPGADTPISRAGSRSAAADDSGDYSG